MAEVRIQPDGTVQVRLASQDIGGGARTVCAINASRTFGYLALERIEVQIGDSDYPPSGASGGSGTTSQVTGQVGQACERARGQLFDLVAARLGVAASELRMEPGRIESARGSLSWKEACRLIRGSLVGRHAPEGLNRSPYEEAQA